jgi:putative YjhG/YagF family dehydratase
MAATSLLDSADPEIYALRTRAPGPAGRLPLDAATLGSAASGSVFGLTQNVGMGWDSRKLLGREFLILSTQGGIRSPDGTPVALGYHTGHWEVGLLMEEAARTLSANGAIPFAGYCSDPCDGRTNGTPGMLDSLPYRNDAAIVFRRLIRSLPNARGVVGVATCDKGLPAMMMALAGAGGLPAVLVPGGVALLAEEAEDTAKVQTLSARFAHGEISLEYAAEMGCRACGSPGGGCQFMGTAATSQVVGEALGLSLPHSALSPSGAPIWRDMARRSALALMEIESRGLKTADILTEDAFCNAMALHVAFGGSTNLLLHLPAIAHAARVGRPTVEEWAAASRRVPRLVDVLPNGPANYATVQVFLAGGVPEVMLHLRDLGLLRLGALTVSGQTLGENIDWWQASERRRRLRAKLWELDGIDPDRVILSPKAARASGLTGTVTFLRGNLSPDGALVKSTAIDPSLVGPDGVFLHEGPARVFGSEQEAIAAIKSTGPGAVSPGDVLVLIGIGPAIGMPETYQVTSALRYLARGKHVAVLTDGRFSGVSTGACVGHVSPEAYAGGPIGRLLDGDRVRIRIDTRRLEGSVDVISVSADEFARRGPNPSLKAPRAVPDDTRLWSALQGACGGAWGGCVYDADRISGLIARGLESERAARVEAR